MMQRCLPAMQNHRFRHLWAPLSLWVAVTLLMVMVQCSVLPAAAQTPTVTNKLGMTFVLIPAGTFIMGSPVEEANRDVSENQHPVTISKPFFMQTTEVTVDQWRGVMGRRFFARKRGAGDMPVVRVSWQDCKEFITTLNRMNGDRYRLPTEAQWEYAARAGSTTAYFWGETIDCSRAMYANNPLKNDECVAASRIRGFEAGCRAPIGQYPPNAWGLYDMHGNVWEWCEDFFGRYPAVSPVDPCKTDFGNDRVRRGGSWFGTGSACRSANRAFGHPMSRLQNTGFRLVMIPPGPPMQTDTPQ